MSSRETTPRTAVLKELGRMTVGVVKTLAIPLLGIGLAISMYAAAGFIVVTYQPHVAVYTWILQALDAVPEIFWTTMGWVVNVFGFLITIKLAHEIWTIARQRAQERENDA